MPSSPLAAAFTRGARRVSRYPIAIQPQSKTPMEKIRALIVDSSVMRKIVERSLRQARTDLAKVREAGDGAEALLHPAGRFGRSHSLRHQHARNGWPRVCSPVAIVRNGPRTGRHDHDLGQRVACGAGALFWRKVLHPRALYSRSSQRTRHSPSISDLDNQNKRLTFKGGDLAPFKSVV